MLLLVGSVLCSLRNLDTPGIQLLGHYATAMYLLKIFKNVNSSSWSALTENDNICMIYKKEQW